MVETQSAKPRSPKKSASAPGLPSDLKRDLAALKEWVSQPEMESVVLRLRGWKALSTDELANLLGRNRHYVRQRLITPMLRAKRLARTIPTQPRHPQQKYRATVS